jgi:hypothetical protein
MLCIASVCVSGISAGVPPASAPVQKTKCCALRPSWLVDLWRGFQRGLNETLNNDGEDHNYLDAVVTLALVIPLQR